MNALRALHSGDKKMIHEWRNLPEVAKYMYGDHYINPDEHERWFQRIMQDETCRYWIIVCNGRDVGLACISNLDQQSRRCYWAFYVANPNIRGKGTGSFVEYSVLHYVFDDLKLNKLCCEVMAFNEAVVNMHKGFGFKQEGLFREHILKGGEPVDVVCLAMLRQEWESLKPGIENRLRQKGVIPGNQKGSKPLLAENDSEQ